MSEISARRLYAPSRLILHLERDLPDAVSERWNSGNPDPLPRSGHATFDELSFRIGLHNAWGDCPSGCKHEEIFYFIVRSGHLERVERNEARDMRQFRELLAAPE